MMFVKLSFKVHPLQIPNLKHLLEMGQLPLDVSSLLDKNMEPRVVEADHTENYVYLSWKAALAKQPTDASNLVAALRLVWRMHKWTAQYAVKLASVHIFE